MDDRALMQMALDALKDAALCVQHNSCPPDGGNDWDEQIEALRDRLAQPEPEAVAWMWKDGTLTSDPDFADGTWTPLFAAPPKREWVGLTNEEIVGFIAFDGASLADFIRCIEAKLKEKNCG